MRIRNANLNDIESIVKIHCDAFKDFFLTSLGPDFLFLYYSIFAKSIETVILVAEETDIVVGFSAATLHSRGFNSRLIKDNLLRMGMFSIKMLFTNPKALLRLVRNLKKKSSVVDDNAEYAELFSLGVCNSQQGKGIGKQILAETEKAIRQKGIEKVSLTTDYDNNDSTVAFYSSMGYKILYVFDTYPNRKMYRLIKTL